MAIKTYWVDSTRPDDTGDGETYATAKKTLAAGLALLNAQSTKGDILNIVNSAAYEWPASYTTISKGRGTSWTDYGRLIRGVSDASATPALVTISCAVDENKSFIRYSSSGDTETTAAGWFVLENLDFDATALTASKFVNILESIESSGRMGPAKFRYCAFRFAPVGGPAHSVVRRVWDVNSYGSKYGSPEFEYCYFQNASYPFDYVGSYGSTVRTTRIDHCVYYWDIDDVSSSLWASLGIVPTLSNTISFTHNTVYFDAVSDAIGYIFDGPIASEGANIGELNCHSNLVWQQSTGITAKLGNLLMGSTLYAGCTNSGVIGYNVLLGGPNMSASDIGSYGWYQKPWDQNGVDVSGENDAYPTDVTAFEVANTAVFHDPGSTYDWVLPNPSGSVTIVIPKDLRPQMYETSGYEGSTPGALPAYSTDYSIAITADRPVPYAGDTVRYTIVVGNTGNNATDVTVSAPIPNGVTYVSHTASTGTFDYATGTWSIPTLNDGATANLVVVTTVDFDQAGQTITYAVEVTDGTPVPDPDALSDDTDSVDITVVSTSRVPYLDVQPMYAPDLRLEVNSSLQAYVNRVRRSYERFDDEGGRWREFATKMFTVAASATVDLVTGLEYYYYVLLESDQPVEVSVGPSGSDVFFPSGTMILLAPTFAGRIQVRNPGTATAVVTITVVDNGDTG